ncbi:MAG: hypothetical protein ATN35_08245 [Epulopiscium sp. Nele67-Bin004]|nr:MAG: hypothetical protein ATN35_08245 [Epulopiscium sp. Nele67-Bin004]
MSTMQFQKIVPNYYFRFDQDMNASNGSFCGNDVETTAKMCRKYIVDSCLRWIQLYGFDGFRFDLMGIIDVDTINEIKRRCSEVDPSVMIYGEGWNMPTMLDESKRATMMNHAKIPQVAHFNDRFRGAIKSIILDTVDRDAFLMESFVQVLQGSVLKNGQLEPLFDNVYQTINYVECHDNSTLQDYLQYQNGVEDEAERVKKANFALTLVMLSQGIPFIHSGQEFYRTKQGVDNSYNSSDEINQIDWLLREKNDGGVQFAKQLIQLRKDYPHFRLNTQEISDCITISNIKDGVWLYSITKGSTLDIYINIGSTTEVAPQGALIFDTMENQDEAKLTQWQIKIYKR